MNDQSTAMRAIACINMLGSDNEGEMMNAARVIAGNARKRDMLVSDYLRTLLLALDARAAAPQAAQPAPQPEPEHIAAIHVARLHDVLRSNVTTAWEKQFANDVLRRGRPLSERQVVSLQRAVQRMTDADIAATADAVAQRERERQARNAEMQARARAEREAADHRRDYAAEARATAQANRPMPGSPCPF